MRPELGKSPKQVTLSYRVEIVDVPFVEPIEMNESSSFLQMVCSVNVIDSPPHEPEAFPE